MLVFIAVSLEVIRNGTMNQIKISVNFNSGSSFSFETWKQIYLKVHPVEDKTFGNIVIAIVILVKILIIEGNVLVFMVMIGIHILIGYSIMVKVMFLLN